MVRVYLKAEMGRPEVEIVRGHERTGKWAFWHGIEVDTDEQADALEATLTAYLVLGGYHYDRFGRVFQLAPIYQVERV